MYLIITILFIVILLLFRVRLSVFINSMLINFSEIFSIFFYKQFFINEKVILGSTEVDISYEIPMLSEDFFSIKANF